MKYLLDTNALIAVFRGDDRVLAHLRSHRPEDVGLSAIVAHELFYGAFRSVRVAANLARIDALRLPVLPFGSDEARRSGEIRAVLAEAGTPIGPFDLLIAGQAMVHGLTLVTRNTREFSRVAGLTIEDWES